MIPPPSPSFTIQLLRLVSHSSWTSLTFALSVTATMAYCAAHESRRIGKSRDYVTFCDCDCDCDDQGNNGVRRSASAIAIAPPPPLSPHYYHYYGTHQKQHYQQQYQHQRRWS